MNTFSIEVTLYFGSEIPQGMILEKDSKSEFTFNANPCIVYHLDSKKCIRKYSFSIVWESLKVEWKKSGVEEKYLDNWIPTAQIFLVFSGPTHTPASEGSQCIPLSIPKWDKVWKWN